MVDATEAETTQKDEAAAEGTEQEDTTLVGIATEVAKEEGTTESGAAKRAIDESAEEPAQKEQTPVKEQKVTKEAAREPRTTRVTKEVS